LAGPSCPSPCLPPRIAQGRRTPGADWLESGQRQHSGGAMGRAIAITTRHGTIDAWRADPLDGAQRGALVVVQEIFGVNEHIRAVVERYAAEGYVAVAPDMFAPVQPHVEL